MAALTANWVKESTATTGTGTITLGGAETGFIKFADTFLTTETVHYIIEDGDDKEYGIGTLTTGSPWTLARTTVLETLVSGTFDDTSPTAISLTGNALVGVAPVAYPPGTIVDSALSIDSTLYSTTGTFANDDTIPQSTEGGEFITQAYTPKYASSILRVTVQVYFKTTANRICVAALFRDSDASATATSLLFDGGACCGVGSIVYDFAATATTSTTFKVRVGQPGDTTYVNANNSNAASMGGTLNSFIKIEEIRQ